jgi:drug/metabolite transporter (DMT)-like permease
MSFKDWAALLVLASFWGASFLCMRIAAPVFGPVPLVELRLLLAGVALWVYARLAGEGPVAPEHRWPLMVVGVLNFVLPFTLISAAELVLPASLAATLNSATPLFGAALAATWLREPMKPHKFLGLALGIVGVGLLVGLGPVPLSAPMAVASAASLSAALLYAVSAVYTRLKLQGVPPTASVTYSQLCAAAALFPAAPFMLPKALPGWDAILAVVFLALPSTAIANVIYFRLIARVGPVRATMVTYLVPVFGMVWGALFLHETLSAGMGAGFALVVASLVLINRA